MTVFPPLPTLKEGPRCMCVCVPFLVDNGCRQRARGCLGGVKSSLTTGVTWLDDARTAVTAYQRLISSLVLTLYFYLLSLFTLQYNRYGPEEFEATSRFRQASSHSGCFFSATLDPAIYGSRLESSSTTSAAATSATLVIHLHLVFHHGPHQQFTFTGRKNSTARGSQIERRWFSSCP